VGEGESTELSMGAAAAGVIMAGDAADQVAEQLMVATVQDLAEKEEQRKQMIINICSNNVVSFEFFLFFGA